jgi:hypothetical protein
LIKSRVIFLLYLLAVLISASVLSQPVSPGLTWPLYFDGNECQNCYQYCWPEPGVSGGCFETELCLNLNQNGWLGCRESNGTCIVWYACINKGASSPDPNASEKGQLAFCFDHESLGDPVKKEMVETEKKSSVNVRAKNDAPSTP